MVKGEYKLSVRALYPLSGTLLQPAGGAQPCPLSHSHNCCTSPEQSGLREVQQGQTLPLRPASTYEHRLAVA
jgi:hypothetical protein